MYIINRFKKRFLVDFFLILLKNSAKIFDIVK